MIIVLLDKVPHEPPVLQVLSIEDKDLRFPVEDNVHAVTFVTLFEDPLAFGYVLQACRCHNLR